MDEKHKKAIVLKYEGKSYAEIAKATGFTENTVNSYFVHDGLLAEDYALYEAEQNEKRKRESQALFKKESANAAKAILQQLALAIQEGDRRNVILIAQIILENAGVGGKDFAKETDDKPLTYEQFTAELERRGIDPKTGIRKRAIEVVSSPRGREES